VTGISMMSVSRWSIYPVGLNSCCVWKKSRSITRGRN